MSLKLWEAKISKLLRFKHPEFSNKLHDFVVALASENQLGWDDDTIVDAVYEKFWEDLEPLSSLPEAKRTEVLKAFEGKQAEAINKEILRAWLHEVDGFDSHIQDLENLELQTLYNEYEKQNSFEPVISIRARKHEELEFYNDVKADADFGYWNRMPTWTLEEAAVLSFGKDPRLVNDETLSQKLSYRYKHLQFVKDLNMRVEQIKRSIDADLLKEPITPAKLADWAFTNSVDVSEDIKAAGKRTKRTNTSVEIEHLRLKSIYKLVLGLAVGRFKHKNVGNSPAITPITELLQDTEFALDRKVVLEILRDANCYISDS
jgi:hypothetical protein